MSEYIYDTAKVETLPTQGFTGEEIIRCRDCEFCHKNYCEKMTSPTVSPSEIFWVPVEPDGFCKWAERRQP